MFAARPIVATDVGEVGAALDAGGAGIIVPPDDAAALAAAVDSLLTHPERARRLGERARARATAEYDVRSMVHRYTSIYQDLLTAGPQPAASRPTPTAYPPSP
jgi:glycosyltransferase involved in cell wall biosynthesis